MGLATVLVSTEELDEGSLHATDLAGGRPLCFLGTGFVGVSGTFISGILTSSFSLVTTSVYSGNLTSGSDIVNS